ncbi:hypothetical protein [Kibdelosporangium philippinense]|uniref:hypothetical protein n=1 Tax=Kibdelosporangium philippinense TaxID=211113 RepID=UPI003612D1C7
MRPLVCSDDSLGGASCADCGRVCRGPGRSSGVSSWCVGRPTLAMSMADLCAAIGRDARVGRWLQL